MDLLNNLFLYIVPFLCLLTILVFVHEMGHFLVARWNGVRVEAFSIGFGRELFGWNDRHGTRWKFSAIPLGGYVKMFGDADPTSFAAATIPMTETEKSESFHFKRLSQRAAVVAAGPIANFLFAILLLAGLFVIAGQPYTVPLVEAVVPDTPAAAAGILPGDRVVRIDGTDIARFEEMQRYIKLRPAQAMEMVVERDGTRVPLKVTSGSRAIQDRFGNEQREGFLGVQSTKVAVLHRDPATAVWQAMRETWNVSAGTLHALGQMVAGTRDSNEIGGVLRIAEMSGQMARDGWINMVWFAALLSINLGLINLMPIPVLDGGHLLFYAAEALRGRPLSKRVQEYGSMAGLAAVLALMVFATWNDLVYLQVVAFFSSLVS